MRGRFCHSLTHSLTRPLTPLLVRFCNRWLSSATPFKFSAFSRAKHHFGFIYFTVKTRLTSAKYSSAGNANHGIFQLKSETARSRVELTARSRVELTARSRVELTAQSRVELTARCESRVEFESPHRYS